MEPKDAELRAYAASVGEDLDALLSAAATVVAGPVRPILSLTPQELQMLVDDDETPREET